VTVKTGPAFIGLTLLIGVSAALLEQVSNRQTRKDRVTVTYWEKWTGTEADEIRRIVSMFNDSQERIFVKILSTSDVAGKTRLATSGGNPPDIAGVWENNVAAFADANALVDLTPFAKVSGIKESDYIDVYWQMMNYRGKLYAMPSTPSSTAMHFNRKFMPPDVQTPEQAPKTLGELDRLVDRISTRKPDGSLIMAGFMPGEPGWWSWGWGTLFGGNLYNEETQELTINSKENIAALNWVMSYTKRFGLRETQTFQSSFGGFGTPQAAFFNGKVGSVIQGVWLANYIHDFGKGMDWFAAPIPVVDGRPDLAGTNFVGCDVLMIPRGAAHPKEAWEFILFVQQQKIMEDLCASHGKNSPLNNVSEEFFRTHKNKEIRLFDKLARSKNAVRVSKVGMFPQIQGEFNNALQEANLGLKTPEKALDDAQNRMKPLLKNYLKYMGLTK